jgi:hypothetical protein
MAYLNVLGVAQITQQQVFVKAYKTVKEIFLIHGGSGMILRSKLKSLLFE